MKLTILGNNSALPAYQRHPTAQFLSLGGEDLLIDCGEGTQIRMAQFGLRWKHLHHILISHLHGDHYFGLPGLLTSMSLLQRQRPLHLYAPAALAKVLDTLWEASQGGLDYPLIFHALSPEGGVFEEDRFQIQYFPVHHRIPCYGFRISTRPRPRRIDPEKAEKWGIPRLDFSQLAAGKDYTLPDGRQIANTEVTEPGKPALSYAYSADTRYSASLVPHFQGADLLYHDATYMDADQDKAYLRYHSTAVEAAQIAAQSGVKKLLLGHFSSRYKDLQPMLEEARQVFAATELSIEGQSYEIGDQSPEMQIPSE